MRANGPKSTKTLTKYDINTCGVPETLEESANSEVPLWEAVQAVVNNQLRAFAIEGRSGQQSVVIDDHKHHCEVNPSKHRNLNVKFIKHVADNRWGMVIDTIVCTTTLLIASLQVAIKGRKNHDNLKNQVYASAFGRDHLLSLRERRQHEVAVGHRG